MNAHFVLIALCAMLSALCDSCVRMSHEDSYPKAFPFDKLVEGMLNLQMIEDTVNMMLEAIKPVATVP